MQKIERYATLKPSPINRGSRSVALEALANIGQTISDTAFTIGKGIRQKEGKIEGAKAGSKAAETGEAPEQKQSIFPTVYGESFNNAQQAAYLASTDRQAVERLVELENEFSHDSEGYQASAKGLMKGLLKNAPPEYQQQLKESIESYASRGGMRINENILKQGQKEAASELLGAVDTYTRESSRAARNGDVESVTENLEKIKLAGQALVDSKQWTKEQADESYRVARNETTEQAYLQIVDDMPLSEASRAIDDAEKDVMPGFSGDEHDAMIARARTRLQKRMLESAKSEASGKSAEYKNRETILRTAVRVGEGDPDELIEELNFLYQRDVFTPAQYAGIFGTIHDDLRGKQKVWERIGNGDPSILVDPNSVEKVYKQDYSHLDNADKVDFAQKVNMIPDLMKREITNKLYAGDIQLAGDAADTISRLSEIQGLPDSFAIKDRAYASQLTALMDLYAPEEAIKIARQNTDPRDKERIDFRREEIKSGYKPEHWQKGANKALGSFFKGIDSISMPVVSKDYETAFTRHYLAGMDEGQAEDAAKADLRRVYSDWNGRPMKHSPEKYYSINGDSSWVSKELKQDLKFAIAGAPDIKDYYLISDDRTSREAVEGNPSYLVRYKTDSGWDVFFERYQPDKNTAIEGKKSESMEEIQKMRSRNKKKESLGVNIPGVGGI